MKNSHVGVLILGVALLLFFIVMSFNNALQIIVDTTCTHGVACPMHVTLKTQKIISYGLMGLLVLVGLFILFFMKEGPSKQEFKKELTQEEKNKKLENLDDEEKKVMGIIFKENGSVYQSDLIRETSNSKVKITRILDRLEGRALIERKRRGMTNIVILK